MVLFKRLAGAGLAASFAACLATMGPVNAQRAVSVDVNGQPITFDQPPVMRTGRVFVPLRGVFERLGASVVYANGDINASGNGRNVHLHIGQTQATVNGQPVYMDVAPFLVGARTLVPLRFVAQALGAVVNWNDSNSTVYIQGGGGASSYVPPSNASFHLDEMRPATHANTTHPAIHATFSEAVNRDSLRVSIDGRDVTPQVYANQNGFDVSPNFELYSGTHRVSVSGSTQAGASFSTGWSFTTSSGTAANYVRNLNPSPGAKVGGTFTLSGSTTPGSSVHIVASGSANALGGLLQVGTGTFQTDTQADGNGNFTAQIGLNAVSGGQVRVIITATTPSGASIERQVVYGS